MAPIKLDRIFPLLVSCIDHINIRAADILIKSAIINQELSDHYFIGCHLQHHGMIQHIYKSNCARVTITDMIRFDVLVAAFDWDDFLRSQDDTNLYPAFVEIWQPFNVAAKKEVFFRKGSDKPWFNTHIMVAIMAKEALWLRSREAPKNLEISAEFRCARNSVSAIIRSAKRRYFQGKLFQARSNSRDTWELINTIRGRASWQPTFDSLQRHFGTDLQPTFNHFNELLRRHSGLPGTVV